MYLKKTDINTTASANGGAIFSSNYYWSSSELGSGFAWNQFFDDGDQDGYDKSYADGVRAVWAF